MKQDVDFEQKIDVLLVAARKNPKIFFNFVKEYCNKIAKFVNENYLDVLFFTRYIFNYEQRNVRHYKYHYIRIQTKDGKHAKFIKVKNSIQGQKYDSILKILHRLSRDLMYISILARELQSE